MMINDCFSLYIAQTTCEDALPELEWKVSPHFDEPRIEGVLKKDNFTTLEVVLTRRPGTYVLPSNGHNHNYHYLIEIHIPHRKNRDKITPISTVNYRNITLGRAYDNELEDILSDIKHKIFDLCESHLSWLSFAVYSLRRLVEDE